MNGYKHKFLWWLLYGIPLILFSLLPEKIKTRLFNKYSTLGKNKKL